LMGGLQAFAAGVLIAAYGRLIGKPRYWVAALAGLISFAIMVVVWPQTTTMGNVSMAATHIFAALICWGIVKRFWTDPS
jgi:peptidoglycan/LPS O-acetylase OafA/YrhL